MALIGDPRVLMVTKESWMQNSLSVAANTNSIFVSQQFISAHILQQLDEPSTGMDALSRRHLWSVLKGVQVCDHSATGVRSMACALSKLWCDANPIRIFWLVDLRITLIVQSDRCTILTTHSMEEAEVF